MQSDLPAVLVQPSYFFDNFRTVDLIPPERKPPVGRLEQTELHGLVQKKESGFNIVCLFDCDNSVETPVRIL